MVLPQTLQFYNIYYTLCFHSLALPYITHSIYWWIQLRFVLNQVLVLVVNILIAGKDLLTDGSEFQSATLLQEKNDGPKVVHRSEILQFRWEELLVTIAAFSLEKSTKSFRC